MPLRLGWFSTGQDQAAIDLFEIIYEAIADGTIDAVMSFCFMNRAAGESPECDRFVETVKAKGIPIISVSSALFKPELRAEGRTDPEKMKQWRLEYDREAMSALAGHSADLIVLAGYMLIVGPEMCGRYTMINLHPALPGGPTGTWKQVIEQLIDTGAEKTGAMMHLVTPELDRGPAISSFSFTVSGGFDEIRRAGVIRELPLILLTVKEFADGNIKVRDGRVFAGGREMTTGYDLTEKIEQWLREHGEIS
jgi:phosphoribosylglycinamide formyltransferase 1